MKILDTAGTLQLLDTGRRCSVRNVRILAIHCTKNCGTGEDELLHDGILAAWKLTKEIGGGYHNGCDPDSEWSRDPVGTKLKHDAKRSILGEPAGACVACGTLECTGAAS